MTTLQALGQSIAVTAAEASPELVALQRSRVSRTLGEIATAVLAREAEQGRGAA